jgi:hypothetical protein
MPVDEPGHFEDGEEVDPEVRSRVRDRAFSRGAQIRRRRTALRRGLAVAVLAVVVAGGVLAEPGTSHPALKALGGPTTTTPGPGPTISTTLPTTSLPQHPPTTTTAPGGPPPNTTVPVTTVPSASTVPSTTPSSIAPHNTTTTLPTNWTFSSAPVGAGDLAAVSCGGGGFCVAISRSGSGAVVTTDLGATWTLASLPATPVAVSCGAPSDCVIAASSTSGPAAFLVTDDAGTSWSSVAAPVALSSLATVSCWNGSDCMAVGTASSILTAYVTGDGGNTWTQSGQLPVSGVALLDCPAASTCLAAVSGDGVDFVSTSDGGSSWTDSAQVPGVAAATGISCPSTSYCVVTGSDDAAVTSDGGSSWTASNIPGGVTTLGGLACTSTSVCWAAATVSSPASAGASSGAILTSSNGGVSWSEVSESGGAAFRAVACAAPGCVGVGPGETATGGGSS